jgi:hypothetical protein
VHPREDRGAVEPDLGETRGGGGIDADGGRVGDGAAGWARRGRMAAL